MASPESAGTNAARSVGIWLEGRRVRRIVVSRLRFLGDVVLTTPLLRILKAKDRDVRIGYLVEEPYAPVLLHHPHVDVVWALKRRAGSLRREVGQVIQLRREVRAFRPDVSLDLLGMPRSALLLYLCGSPARIGGPYRVRRHLYTHVVQHAEPQISAVHYHLENLRPLGIQGPFAAEDLRTFVRVLPEEVAYVRRSFSLDRDRRPLIGLHPGATWPAKRWFPERFGALASALHSQLGARVVLTTGPGEEELVRRVVEAANGSAQALPVLGLRHLAALLSQLDAYVANDCGPMHLAVAVGTPTIGLFGPSEPRIWFPYRREEGHVALHHPCPAHPCHRDVCDHPSCFRDLPVQEVLEAVVWAVGRKTLAQKAISDLTSG